MTIVVRNNYSPTMAALTATLPSSFSPELATLPPELTYDGAAHSLRWSGPLAGGTATALTVHGTTVAGDGTQGRIVFRDQILKTDYDQPLSLRVNTPDLAGSLLQVPPIHPHDVASVAMIVRNTGPGITTNAVVTGLVPLNTRVIDQSVVVDGPGTAHQWAGGVVWQGGLTSGQSVTISYQIAAPFTILPDGLPVEMLARDGLGGEWEWRAWLDVRPYLQYWPQIYNEK